MTKLALQTVLINLEMSLSLDDLSWKHIQSIAQDKIYMYEPTQEINLSINLTTARLNNENNERRS